MVIPQNNELTLFYPVIRFFIIHPLFWYERVRDFFSLLICYFEHFDAAKDHIKLILNFGQYSQDVGFTSIKGTSIVGGSRGRQSWWFWRRCRLQPLTFYENRKRLKINTSSCAHTWLTKSMRRMRLNYKNIDNKINKLAMFPYFAI